MSFSVDVREFAEKAMISVEKAKQYAAIEIFGAVIKATPVGNPAIWKNPAPRGYTGGRLRGNWRTSVRDPDLIAIARIDKNGTETAKEMTAAVRSAVGDDTIFMTNNLPYAQAVEFGWSQQAPTGMVRVAILGFQNAVAEGAKR